MLPPKKSKRRARQPEGILKDACRDDYARPNALLFIQIEGKGYNGFPDTLSGRVAGGGVFIEFKRSGREPEEQQWRRIAELRAAGIEAWWASSVDDYRRIVGLLPGGYSVTYPAWLIEEYDGL